MMKIFVKVKPRSEIWTKLRLFCSAFSGTVQILLWGKSRTKEEKIKKIDLATLKLRRAGEIHFVVAMKDNRDFDKILNNLL